MKYAQIVGNAIYKIYTAEEAAWYPEGVIDIREVPDNVQEGWAWDGSNWLEPVEPAEEEQAIPKNMITQMAIVELYETMQQQGQPDEPPLYQPSAIAEIYREMITSGLRSIEDVPNKLKDYVKSLLPDEKP